MTQISLGDLFTDRELEEAWAIYKADSPVPLHARLVAWVLPQMDRINEITKQENDAGYWAYAIEYVLGQRVG